MTNTISIIEPETEKLEAPQAELHFEPTKNTGFQGSGYYRLKRKWTNTTIEVGTLGYVYANDAEIRVFICGHEYVYRDKKNAEDDDDDKITSFERDFDFEPNGSKIRQQQIADLMEDIDQTDFAMNTASKALNNFNPYAGAAGQLEGSTSLVTTGGMQGTKLAVATLRNNVTKMKKALVGKTDQLKSWLSEQSEALALKAKDLAAMVAKAEKAIWTINLYLGSKEEILTLKEGKPAPVDQKITIRQKLLFMDEECGLEAREDGIDIQTVAMFDEWLLENPAHLTQVLPETKGIVALHIRSKAKKYEDPWMSAEANKANLNYTYFLVRNGDNVYRIYIDMVIGNHLFPSISEFEEYFWTYEWNGTERVKAPLVPGSEKYIKSMDEADEQRKHYLHIVLVLQGLMDRTPIFKPMATNLINLCDPRHCEEWLHLIYESEKVITDGRPTFKQWQATVNQGLEVGHRIIGIFDYASDIKGSPRDYKTSRLYPENACYPTSSVLHTIDEREGDAYIFRYVREGDRVYHRYGPSHPPTTRARCWVEKDDEFMIDFDSVTLEELQYYQGHKLSRESYKNMVPLLIAAIALKKQETEDEAPFRLLLIGQIMANYSISQLDAEAQVDELIKWWKFKNRTHRALLSDDKKALDMIVAEYGLREKQKKVRERIENVRDLLVRVICGQTPEPVYVAHKSDNLYVAYVPHNDQNIWVREQIWAYNQQTNHLRLKDEKQWRLVDKRHIRWETIHKTDRWDAWKINPQISTVLTEPEITALVDAAIEKRHKELLGPPQRRHFHYDDDDDDENGSERRFLPLGAYYNNEFEVCLWYSDHAPVIPTEKLIYGHSKKYYVNYTKLAWKRTPTGIKALHAEAHQSSDFDTTPGERPWDPDGDPHNWRGAKDPHIIKVWEDNIALYAKEEKAYKAFTKERQKLVEKYDHVEGEVQEICRNQEIAKARIAFDADFGDPELWPDHLAGLKIRSPHFNKLETAIKVLTDDNIEIEGWPLLKVFEEAAKHGLHDRFNRADYQSELDMIPVSYRITKKPPQESEDE